MNLYVLIPGIALFINFFVWVYVFAQQKRDPIAGTFLLFVLCAIGWIASELLLYLPESRGHELTIFRIVTLFWMPCGFWFLLFAYALVGRKRDWILYSAFLAAVAGVSFIVFTDKVILGADHFYWGVGQTLHPVYQPLIATVTAFTTAYALLLVFKKWSRSDDRQEKKALGLLIYGALICMSAISVMNVYLPVMVKGNTFPQFGSSAFTVFVVTVFMAVTRYRFLSISVEKVATDLFEDLQEGVLLTDRTGRIQRSNAAARDLLTGSLAGRDLQDIFTTLDLSEDCSDRVIPWDLGGSKKYLTISISTISKSDEVLGRIIIIRDITRQREAEKVLLRSNEELENKVAERTEQLRHAQRMEAIGTLAGGIAHDFNNVLAAILGFANTARSETPKESPLRNDLEEIIIAGTRGREIVRQILTLARKRDSSHFVPIHFDQLVNETLDLLKGSLPENVVLRTKLAKEPLTVCCDDTQLSQVIMNICNNAVYAMKDKSEGILEVGLEEVEIDDALVKELPYLKPGSGVRFYVSDNGIGIHNDNLQQIFNPFFTTKPQGEGTGLGLSSSFVIVHNHNGDIRVESALGKGTTFLIYLPISDIKEPDTNTPSRVSDMPPRFVSHSEKILFVDDDPQILRMGRRLLEQLGYQVATSSNGQDALETLLRSSKDDYNLIITDYSMPEMTGVEMAAALNRHNSEIPIILMSGHGEDVADKEVHDLGIAAYLPKPATKNQLKTTVRRILDGVQ